MRQAELRYYPYGKTRYTYGATPTTYRFTGQRQQANANELYFYQSRWYDPLVGRFLSADTIVPDPKNPQSLNRYTYVGNSPLKYVDPTGHAEQTPDEDETALLAYWKALAEQDPSRLDGEIWAWLADHQDMYTIDGMRSVLEGQFGNNMASIPAAFGTIYATAYAGADLLDLHDDPKAPLLAGFIWSLIAISDAEMGDPNGTTLRGMPRQPGPTVDPLTGYEVGRFVGDAKGNIMIEPVGGTTVRGANPVDTHTLYPNGSNYQRLNPQGHGANTSPHGHGHLLGTGPGKAGQGPSLSVDGRVVNFKSPDAHWPIK